MEQQQLMLRIQIQLCKSKISYNVNQIILKKLKNLWFYSKDEVTDFHADISYDNKCKLFKYKAKLLGNTQAANANRFLKMQQLLSH